MVMDNAVLAGNHRNCGNHGNPPGQVIIYGGIQQDGIVLSVHTKTVNTSMKRSNLIDYKVVVGSEGRFSVLL